MFVYSEDNGWNFRCVERRKHAAIDAALNNNEAMNFGGTQENEDGTEGLLLEPPGEKYMALKVDGASNLNNNDEEKNTGRSSESCDGASGHTRNQQATRERMNVMKRGAKPLTQ